MTNTLLAAARTAGIHGTVNVRLADGSLAKASAQDILAGQPGQTIRIWEGRRSHEFFWASQLTAA